MRSIKYMFSRWAVLAIILPLTGCSTIGPASLRTGRTAYFEAIAATDDQQLLNFIVRYRYGEGGHLLAVSSVTANFKVSGRVEAQFPIGPQDYYRENLVPLTGGMAYEDNPTITYAPVQGEACLRMFLSPLPVDLTILALEALESPGIALTMLVKRINGVDNTSLQRSESDPDAETFARIAELTTELDHLGCLWFAQVPDSSHDIRLVMQAGVPEAKDRVEQLARLLSLQVATNEANGRFVVPIRLGMGTGGGKEIEIVTRTLFSLVRIASAAVEVPESHVTTGLASSYPPLGLVGEMIRIRRSTLPPDHAVTAVRQEGYWYYIDKRDQASKRYFRMLSTLINTVVADAGRTGQGAPLLTLPVGG